MNSSRNLYVYMSEIPRISNCLKVTNQFYSTRHSISSLDPNISTVTVSMEPAECIRKLADKVSRHVLCIQNNSSNMFTISEVKDFLVYLISPNFHGEQLNCNIEKLISLPFPFRRHIEFFATFPTLPYIRLEVMTHNILKQSKTCNKFFLSALYEQ